MTCGPCYLARQEDWPRNFACMRGLEPNAVQEMSEILLARPVERRIVEPPAELEPRVTVAPKLRRVTEAAKPRPSGRRQMSSVAD
jgi:hypothetical protein